MPPGTALSAGPYYFSVSQGPNPGARTPWMCLGVGTYPNVVQVPVTVEAVGLKPGKTHTVDVRLPVEVLKMAIDYEGRPAAFNVFVALLDSDNDLAETNEDNNILVISREKIQSVK